MKKVTQTFFITLLAVLTLSTNFVAQGFTIEKHENVPVENNFVVGPAKIETEVPSGEVKTVSVVIDNKTGRTQTFSISFEDFIGTNDSNQTIKLLGTEKSKTTLKDYLSVEKKEFTLEQGDRAIVPVTISIPVGIPAGGRFGVVDVSAVSNVPAISDSQRTYTGATIIGRVATLLFVTVPGQTNPQGKLLQVATKNNSKIFFSETIPLRVLFQNTGNVNLNPYGIVELKNMFGHTIASQVLDPQFVLPDSERTRDVVFTTVLPFGRYTAVVQMNRGYGNLVDEQSVSFFVISPISLSGLVIVLAAIVVWIRRRIMARKKNNTDYAA